LSLVNVPVVSKYVFNCLHDTSMNDIDRFVNPKKKPTQVGLLG